MSAIGSKADIRRQVLQCQRMTHLGHEWARLRRCAALTCYTFRDPWPWDKSNEAAQIHHAHWPAALTWPVVGHAQQRVMPLVGVLCAGTAQALERYLASFREGMQQLE